MIEVVGTIALGLVGVSLLVGVMAVIGAVIGSLLPPPGERR
jgi:hypothetical protein